ncbi:hypothetical protein LK07_02305 [Streptomyces pluripotens]|uniref:Uncharacterized protein n=1 Tax=Streptomyces pluripotens TaxID=1355015 RepID=A0A221NSU4_9ACTN|nr:MULTISPECIES: hypothetical protein [Streptomyces]ARP68791.1 hypothetical protein LK06_001215 [Streptomyces pluripotens]ASN23047.1 hypothetical protein LK07_02305 [Streptomyces pluripotens]MCH0558473.1 hypothetical protein [Streptomyces sp. MUM 16J]
MQFSVKRTVVRWLIRAGVQPIEQRLPGRCRRGGTHDVPVFARPGERPVVCPEANALLATVPGTGLRALIHLDGPRGGRVPARVTAAGQGTGSPK